MLGAAVADDILGLVILTVVTRIVTQGSVSALGIAWVVVVAVGFVVLATLIGIRIVPPVFAFVRRYSRSAGTLVAIAFAFTLAVSELRTPPSSRRSSVRSWPASRWAAAPRPTVCGGSSRRSRTCSSRCSSCRSASTPKSASSRVRPCSVRPAVLLVVAVLGKLCSVLGLVGSPGDRLLVGIGMIPRGEVGLIFATLGLNQGVFGQDVYAALLLVVLVTTVATPPALRWRYVALRARVRSSSAAASSVGVALVHVGDNGLVELDAEPVPSDALVVALRAARSVRHAPASAALMEWLGAFPPGPGAGTTPLAPSSSRCSATASRSRGGC